MILCHCTVVDHRAVEAAVDDGARSTREVLLRTGAGRGCGGCVPAIRACAHARLCQGAMESAAAVRAETPEVLHAAG
jgi:NAD(P)H-nitrite reductase large subunit